MNKADRKGKIIVEFRVCFRMLEEILKLRKVQKGT